MKTLLKYVLFICLLVGFPAGRSFAEVDSKYPETIAVLQESYNGEVAAYRQYFAYAKRAQEEKYPSIAYLFISLASSEQIHARNFRKAVANLSVELKEPPDSLIDVSNTKASLKNAVNVEMSEVDHKYPDFIARMKTEDYKEAMQAVVFAWEAEKQHRDLIEKIQSNIGLFFGTIAKKIESNPTEYYVCQICGSTQIEIPQYACPICKNPASSYILIENNLVKIANR